MSSKEYVAGRVRAALVEAKGNAVTAQRTLIAECAGDGRLLRGLVGPFLQGIVAHAVGQAAGPTAARPQSAPSVPRAATTVQSDLSANALETVIGQLGKSIGEASLPKGMTALTEPPSRPEAGSRHQEAIRQMVNSYKQNRGTH